jgi:hypothetical protein
MTKGKTSDAISQAQFAALHGVARSTVTDWKARGYIVFTQDGLVNVPASNAILNGRPSVNRGGQAKGPAGGGDNVLHFRRLVRAK